MRLPHPTRHHLCIQASHKSAACSWAPFSLLAPARPALARAQAAMASGHENDARNFALAAAADADLAYAKSREALASTELAQRRSEIADLQRRLQMEDGQ